MASSVFYKFASQRTESRVTFDGTGISVFDLKKEVILANNLGKANDFDLFVYDPSGEEYKDDSQIISRSSTVVVKRRPAVRPGKGKAAMYIAGAGGPSASTSDKPTATVTPANNSWHRPGLAPGNLSKRFDTKEREDPSQKSSQANAKSSVTPDDEAAAMAAMFQAQTANWEETQEKMSHAVRIYNNPRGTAFSRGGKPSQPQPQQPDRPLPPSYVCYRCGKKGHWIQDCPTNNDREFDNKPRIKRTTGIPRSFLKSVDNPNGQLSHGVMVTPEGGYVVAQPDSAAWQKQVTRPKGSTEADIRERTPTDSALICPMDNKLFRDAVKTPCCEASYCEECIQTTLLERDFICPNCGEKIASLDKLVASKTMRARVTDYIDKAIEDSKKEENGEEATNPTVGSSTNGTQDASQDAQSNDQEYYVDQSADMDVARMLEDSIPQLQAQISQISRMLQNPSLPNPVRQATEIQYQQRQMELHHAQTMAAAITAAATLQQQQQNQVQQQQQQQQAQQQQQQQQVQQQHQMALAAVASGIGMPPFNMNPNMNMPMNMGGMTGFPQAGLWTNPFPNQQPAGKDSAYQRLPLNNRRRNLKRERPSDFLEVGSSDREGKVARFWE